MSFLGFQKLYFTKISQYLIYHNVSLFLISLLFLFILRTFRSRAKSNSPPSPPRLPVIGNLHQLGMHVHRSLGALSDQYGPLMLLQLGQVPTLVVSSAELVKEMFKNHDVVFSDRPKTTGVDIFCYGGKDVGFAPYGEHWRQARKLLVLELLSLKRVQQFQSVRDEETTLLLSKIRKASFSRVSLNLSEALVGTSNNIVSRCVLGQRYEEENGESRFGDLTRKVMVDFMAFSVRDFFPKFGWIDVVRGLIGRLQTNFRELDAFYDEVIEEHKEAMKSNLCGAERNDLVSILLGLQKDGLVDFEFTHEHLKGMIMDMFVGASDTTSTSLEWLMAELVRNPRVMKKAQEEVRRVVGTKQEIDMTDINQMDYLKCVIKENLRLRPPLPLLLARKCSASVEFGGYTVPANARVFVNAWAIQRDPNLWDKPEEFIPERFENNPVDFKFVQDFQYIPFGFGRRGCPGVAFGVSSTEHIIANLLYWFDWKLPDANAMPEDLDMTEVNSLTVHKKVPLNLVPVSYFP